MVGGRTGTVRGTSGVPVRPLAAGAALGAAILGLLGRLATAALAVGLGHPANLGPRGLGESVVVGAVLGAVGGALVPLVRSRGGAPGMRPGMVVGVLLFVVTTVTAVALGSVPGVLETTSLPTLVVVLVVFVIYGAALERAAPASPGDD